MMVVQPIAPCVGNWYAKTLGFGQQDGGHVTSVKSDGIERLEGAPIVRQPREHHVKHLVMQSKTR